jgi:hypothetical protein
LFTTQKHKSFYNPMRAKKRKWKSQRIDSTGVFFKHPHEEYYKYILQVIRNVGIIIYKRVLRTIYKVRLVDQNIDWGSNLLHALIQYTSPLICYPRIFSSIRYYYISYNYYVTIFYGISYENKI